MAHQIDNIVDKSLITNQIESKNSIKETNNVLEILALIKQLADKNTLVVFDVDNVLILQGDTLLRSYILQPALEDCFKFPENSPLYETLYNFIQIASYSSQRLKGHKPVDENMQDVIKYLEENQIKSLALTHASYLGLCDGGITHDQVRYKDLQRLGIDFIKLSGLENSEIISLKDGDQIKLHNGIVFARNQNEKQLNKGICLNAVLDKLSYTPSKIIFVDDVKENHDDVMQICETKNIEFHGFHYTKAYEIEDMQHAYDRAVLQIKMLGKEGRWLNDTEADAMMIESKNATVVDESQSFIGWMMSCLGW